MAVTLSCGGWLVRGAVSVVTGPERRFPIMATERRRELVARRRREGCGRVAGRYRASRAAVSRARGVRARRAGVVRATHVSTVERLDPPANGEFVSRSCMRRTLRGMRGPHLTIAGSSLVDTSVPCTRFGRGALNRYLTGPGRFTWHDTSMPPDVLDSSECRFVGLSMGPRQFEDGGIEAAIGGHRPWNCS
jgi:hypothetical protein